MPFADLGGLSLCYDRVLGPHADRHAIPVLMIQGLGMQIPEWPAELISGLAAERQVVLFDNRDAGLSQLFGPAIDPSLTMGHFPGQAPLLARPPYTLHDMAQDVVQLLDFLNVDKAHLIGFSMGGMIGQIVAASAPSRVASLVGLMTSAGQQWLDCTADADHMMRQSILFEPHQDRLIAQMLAAEAVYAGRSPLPGVAARRAAIQQSFARAYRPAGTWRQARAMRATGSREVLLRAIRTPMLMLHGEDDPVISLAQAALVTTIVPHAAFKILDGTGHILTEQNAEEICRLIKNFWWNNRTITYPETNIGQPP